MATWDRQTALREVRQDLWRYLSAAAEPEDMASMAESLWSLPRGDIRRLVAAHILLSETTASMLVAVERLLPRMPASTQFVEEEVLGRITGPVDWHQTRQRQLTSGDRTRFICRPPDRHYDTPLGRLLSFAVHGCIELLEVTALRGAKGAAYHDLQAVQAKARRLTASAKLKGIPPVVPAAGQLASLARRRDVGPVVAFAQSVQEAYHQLDRSVTEAVVNSRLLAPSSDATLFELLVAFRLMRAIEDSGLPPARRRLIEPDRSHPLARFDTPSGPLTVWWQRSAFPIVADGPGLYADALRDAGLSASALRPDLIVQFPDDDRFVLVEIKHTIADEPPVRAGVSDALLYLMDAREHFDGQPFPHALVVAYGAEAGGLDGRVIATGSDRVQLRDAALALLHRHINH